MELDFRKCRILATIVEEHIETGEPVGSKWLAEKLGNCVSSATIRNDMAALTAAGYLEQPHTSAGRLPTAKAFHLYVDRLMDHRPLTLQDRVDMNTLLAAASGDASRLLADTCRALADITGLAAVASRPEQVGACISRIDVMQMSPRNMAVVLAQDNGFLRTRMCRCQRDIPSKVTVALADYMSRRFLGQPLTAVTLTAMQEILLELGEAGLAVAPILSAFYELALECADARLTLAGQMNLLRHPDYPLDKARALMDFLSDRQNLGALLEPPLEGLRILPGGEWHPSLDGSVMVLVPYTLGNRGTGTIGVVGPMRMNYAEVIPRIHYFATAIGQMLGDLFEESNALDI
ncbi:MAG: heat-inducible transcription repressor HrcA [Clostridia bacterium]|nr:heat-inducible transcription repressor HrcA [Clostridia bacterium]